MKKTISIFLLLGGFSLPVFPADGATFSPHQQVLLLCVRAQAAPALPYDAEVEYLESTGTQWIDTGVYGRPGLIVEALFAVVGSKLPSYVFWGASPNDSLGVYFRNTIFGNYRTCSAFGYILNTSNYTIENSTHSIKIDSTSGAMSIVYDGVIVGASGNVPSTDRTNNPLRLFANDTTAGSATPTQIGNSRIYSFGMYSATSGEPIIDLIAVRKDGVGYMYDRVSGNLLGNAGTGAFVIGPDK